MTRSKKTVSIALLVTDTPPEPLIKARGDFVKIYSEFLFQSLNSIKRHAWQDEIELQIRPYDVVGKMEYPDQGQLEDGLWDAVLVTGSTSSAYVDHEWTTKLCAFLRYTAARHPLVRIMGICYGHQVIARAFGATVVPNPLGWELGTTDCLLTEDGRELLALADEKSFALQQVHKDHVPELPPAFEGTPFLNLAQTDIAPVQALALRYPTEAPPLPSSANTSAYMAFDISDSGTSSSGPSPLRSLHVLTFQGHPEFDEDIINRILELELGDEMGSVDDEELRAQARKNAARPHDGLRIGRDLLAMLGVENARTDTGDQMVNM